jgi:hypothetical protein
MDGLTVLVVAIGSLLLALVAYLTAVDYIDPVPDPRAGPEGARVLSQADERAPPIKRKRPRLKALQGAARRC